MWNLQVPSKVKIFLWKACTDSLPTAEGLLVRNIVQHSGCSRCKLHSESVNHALLTCFEAKKVWKKLTYFEKLPPIEGLPFMDFLIKLKDILTRDEMALFTLYFWSIWFSRNKWVHCKEIIKPDTTISWVNNFYHEFTNTNQITHQQNNHKQGVIFSSSTNHESQKLHTWTPPPPNQFKFNVDAAIDSSNNSFGIGLICRNHLGEVMLAAALFREGRPSVVEAEAYAVLEGTSLALEQGLCQIELESDSLTVISQIKTSDPALSGAGLIVSDILD